MFYKKKKYCPDDLIYNTTYVELVNFQYPTQGNDFDTYITRTVFQNYQKKNF